MTIYREKKVVERSINSNPSAYVSASPAAGSGSIQVGVMSGTNTRRMKTPSRRLAIGGAGLLVALCLMMTPLVGRGEEITSAYPSEGVHEIVVDTSILDVKVKPSEDKAEIGIHWEESDSWDVQVSSEDGVLSIGEDSSIGLHSIRDLDEKNKSRTLTVEIPIAYEGSVTIKSRTGDISVSGMDITGDVALATPYGSVDISNLTVLGDLGVSSDTGSLYLEDVVGDSLIHAESKTGGLSLVNVVSEGLLDASTRMGNITLRDTDAATMEIATLYGAVRAKGVSVESDMHIYSYSGDISCQLRDDADAFTVKCHSAHGRINAPDMDGSGGKRLDVESRMGDITVGFGL